MSSWKCDKENGEAIYGMGFRGNRTPVYWMGIGFTIQQQS